MARCKYWQGAAKNGVRDYSTTVTKLSITRFVP